MIDKRLILFLITSIGLSGCASVDLPSIEFMGQSDFADEIEALDPDYPSLNETPNMPDGVRGAREWDRNAREMEELYEGFATPESTGVMTDDEFDAAFEAGQAEAKAYKADDPS